MGRGRSSSAPRSKGDERRADAATGAGCPHERIAQAADVIRELLGGSLDDCARALARGGVPAAQRELQAAMEQLRRISACECDEGGEVLGRLLAA
jgi:hypothetical protein